MRGLSAALVACLALGYAAAAPAALPLAAPVAPPGSMRIPSMVSRHPPAPVTTSAADDPLADYYGNTLISEKLSSISPYGGAAHVWLSRDHTFISFDASTGGRSGPWWLAGRKGAWILCVTYPFGPICYPIDRRHVGESWVVRDPDALSLNSLVPGQQ